MDTNHLNSLQTRLSNEKVRLAIAKRPSEIAIREVWVSQLDKEVKGELEFLGLSVHNKTNEGLTNSELLNQLNG